MNDKTGRENDMPDVDFVKDIPKEILQLLPDAGDAENLPKATQEAIETIQGELEDPNRAVKLEMTAHNIPYASLSIKGLYRHPPNFTAEEWEIIVTSLRAHLPLSAIAQRVHCERNFLNKKIQEHPEIAQLVADARAAMVDQAEYQIFRAVSQGSLAATIHVLDHLGRDRGWGDAPPEKDAADDVHISFGLISPDDLKEADNKIVAAAQRTTPTLAAELAQVEVPRSASTEELAMAEEVIKKRQKELEPKPIDITPRADGTQPEVHASPYKNMPRPSEVDLDTIEAAFSEGADSPFGYM